MMMDENDNLRLGAEGIQRAVVSPCPHASCNPGFLSVPDHLPVSSNTPHTHLVGADIPMSFLYVVPKSSGVRGKEILLDHSHS